MGRPPAFIVSADILSQPHALLFFSDLMAESTSPMVNGWFIALVGGGSGIVSDREASSRGTCMFRCVLKCSFQHSITS